MGRIKFANQWLKIRVDQYTINSPDGEYTVVERGNGVVVVPISEKGNTLVVRLWRHPIQEKSLELVMGAVDEGEEQVEAGRRELEEEVGLKVERNRCHEIGWAYPLPGLSASRHFVVVVEVTEAELDLAVSNKPGEKEIEAIYKIPFAEIGEKIASGEIHDGYTMCAWVLAKPWLTKHGLIRVS